MTAFQGLNPTTICIEGDTHHRALVTHQLMHSALRRALLRRAATVGDEDATFFPDKNGQRKAFWGSGTMLEERENYRNYCPKLLRDLHF